MNKFYYTKNNLHNLYSWLQKTLVSIAQKGEVYEVTVKKYDKRSNNANALYWKCVEAVANKIGESNTEVHKRFIFDYSTSVVISVRADIDISGYAKYYQECGRAEVNNKPFVHYRIFKGSSEMTTKEFSRLLDGAIEECKELGVYEEWKAELR